MVLVMSDWPTPGPVQGVIFDIHSTLIDQGDADSWLDIAIAREPDEAGGFDRGEVTAFLDRIWEGARISDPASSRDLSFADHSRVFHELIGAGPGISRPLANALYDAMLDTWHAYDDAAPTLAALRELGMRVCLLSNAGVPIRTVLDREGISPLCDAVVLSYEVGAVKPDPRIFRAALDALGCAPDRALMVGDNANDDGGGTHLGLRTLILPRTGGREHGLSAVVDLVRGINARYDRC
jgi:HAD superfamily hydrolase (TIGR01549 family)